MIRQITSAIPTFITNVVVNLGNVLTCSCTLSNRLCASHISIPSTISKHCVHKLFSCSYTSNMKLNHLTHCCQYILGNQCRWITQPFLVSRVFVHFTQLVGILPVICKIKSCKLFAANKLSVCVVHVLKIVLQQSSTVCVIKRLWR